MQYQYYKDIKCKNADELWDLLSPTKELVKEPYDFIYRGQGDATWPLIPSILRKSSPILILLRFCLAETPNADEQVYIEIRLLEIFARLLRYRGDQIT